MDTSQYTEYRPLMFSIAYRMTGSVSDAEDIVQEAFLRAAKDGKDGKDGKKDGAPAQPAEAKPGAGTVIAVDQAGGRPASAAERALLERLQTAATPRPAAASSCPSTSAPRRPRGR